MSLAVRLKHLQIPKCKGEKIIKIEFRGVSHTKVLEDGGDELYIINERYDWCLARPVEANESLLLELYSRNRLFADKLIGTYGVVLQRVVRDGRLSVNDCLVDANNKPMPVNMHFDIVYTAPDASSMSFAGSSTAYDILDDDQQMLIDIEQNIANLERSIASTSNTNTNSQERPSSSARRELKRGRSVTTPDKSPAEKTNDGERRERKRISTLKTVRNLMRLGKQRPPKDKDDEDENTALVQPESGRTSRQSECESAPLSRAASQTSLSSNADSQASVSAADKGRKAARIKSDLKSRVQSVLKAQDFQVCLTIIEARQLAGLNMDPVVCIQVGDQKKYTSVKESTNCPYYNEYFVFDFHMPPIMLFDKIITLSVLQSRSILRGNKLLGCFKLDVATVWSQPDHQFYHKWALLTDPDDIAGGPKGYLKCDISVIGKGDSVKIPPKSEKDEDDIEANLLLPDGVPIDRQRAKFVVKIYRADGLPKMNSSLMANVKKAFTGEVKDLVDPYVQVSFAGLMGKTSVKKHTYAPVWNEQLVFTDMFPPLCQRIKVQLRDDDPVKPTVIGTHFIDLKQIANDGEKGFLPTYGPAFVHLYGSTRDYSLIDELSSLNDGLGEGVSYRARLLIAIRTEIIDTIDFVPTEVELEPTSPVNEGAYGKIEEFFLFATVLEANMLDKKVSDKPVYFELSMGNAGNAIDGHNQSSKDTMGGYDVDSDEIENVVVDSGSWQSTTTPTKPMTHDKVHYFLPYWDNKPCMYILSAWPDYRRRMYNSNLIARMVDKLDEGLHEVFFMLETENPERESRLKQILEELTMGCNKYLKNSKSATAGPGTGKTKLDKEHLKLCQREIEQIATTSRNLRALVTRASIKERYKTANTYLAKLKSLVDDPQHALPDVFLWIISGGKRQAYQRISSRDIIYSIVDEEGGRDCGKVQTMFLKLPGKKSDGPSGWAIQAKLEIYMWLGILKHKKHFVNGIPKGYEFSQEIRNAERPRALPPCSVHYTDKHVFQLRANIYQARSLIGSDASGLSDPFARVIAGEFSKSTQVIDETLSPTWDELLIFDDILIYGVGEDIRQEPPTVIIEIFDQDKVGKSEFIGRAVAKPQVKLCGEQYAKPKFPTPLEWFDITRGTDHAGELLAAFELLEVGKDARTSLPELPREKERFTQRDVETFSCILPVPEGVRPTLVRYRIEVLFWGLRDLKRIHLLTVDRPRVDIECAGHILNSSTIQNAKKNPNFSNPVKFLEIDLPEQELYRPPLTIRAVDCRSFGRYTLVGTHMINSIHKYMYTPVTKRDKDADERRRTLSQLKAIDQVDLPTAPNHFAHNNVKAEKSPLLPKDTQISLTYGTQDIKRAKADARKRRHSTEDDSDDEEGNRDWWTKYFASIENMIAESKEAKKIHDGTALLDVSSDENNPLGFDKSPGDTKSRFGFSVKQNQKYKVSPKNVRKDNGNKKKTALFKIFPTELEHRAEFNGFKEWLQSFELYRGKKTGDETEDDGRIVGMFKGAIKVYKWPLPKDIEDHTIMGFDPQYGCFQGLPSNDPIRVLVRVYIVKGNDLHPMDYNGKADPYIILQLGSKRISDKENYISKQLNPVFGKCFEIEATFPQDSLLTVQIYDWDLVSADDMVGETRIDLENRFYSRHRSTCGLPLKYEEGGYNAWRDALKPTQILAKLCKEGKVESPIYTEGEVRIGRHVFNVHSDDIDYYTTKDVEEHMALNVLHRWQEFPRIGCELVPEHIETRALYNPDKPGIEQGKLEMWVDMFPMDMPLPAAPLDISPRKPRSYELRIIIWNTEDVILEDDAFFTGEKMSDIYVKGWLKGPEDCQSTDIHYRSLTGEGNFNWRFVYPFDYMVAEQKIVISRKETLFSWDETECKIPARLELQVWDADHFSADDFLGAITLDLNRFPRGAKSSKLCTLDMLKSDGSVPMVNIFKQKRVKGWWPFFVKKDNESLELTGKVEAEIHLLTKEEAEKSPVGLGRNEPDALEKPNRPDASFMWFLNPLKSIRYIIWHNYKWTILKIFIIIAVAFIILLFVYAIPGYSVKKLLGA